MDAYEYLKMEAMDRVFSLPAFFFDENEEPAFDQGMQVLKEAGYVHFDDGDNFTYSPMLEEDFPEVFRFFEEINKAETQSFIDSLVESGLAVALLEDDGEVSYGLTAEGVALCQQLGIDL